MAKSPILFAELLTKAVHHIKANENKSLSIIHDELGYALNRKNGSCIEHWRKGFIPAYEEDIEVLAKELVFRGGLDKPQCKQFLSSADYQNHESLLNKLFPPSNEPKSRMLIEKEMSPFVVGPPITQPKQFFGRTKEVKNIFNQWQRFPLQHTAIVGPKRSGKTSLLYYLKTITNCARENLRKDQKQDWLKKPQLYKWIMVDFQDSRMSRQTKLLSFVLEQLNFDVPDSCTLDNFMDIVAFSIKRPIIILMDEIGVALSYSDLDMKFWWSLRALANNYVDGNLSFVISAHDLPTRLSVDKGKPSPFFNMFTTTHLGPFSLPEAIRLVESSPIPFSNENIDWIFQKSHLWPSLLQILCQTYLEAIENNENDYQWREQGLARLQPFDYLIK